jgi:hypothetical protein
MVSCCAPHAVEVTEECYYWCEISSTQAKTNSLPLCLQQNNASNIISSVHLASASNLAMGIGRVVMSAMVVSLLLHVAAI